MKIEKYTRTQLGQIIEAIGTKIEEMRKFLDFNLDAPDAVRSTLDDEIGQLETLRQIVFQRRDALVSRCIFCQEQSEVEVPTIAHICVECDAKTDPRKKG